MKSGVSRGVILATFLLTAAAASAQTLFAYPPEGRTKTQQQKDAFECHQWAVEQAQFDPVEYAAKVRAQSPPASTTSTTASSSASVASSASREPSATRSGNPGAMAAGAAQGAALASVSGGDPGQGAALGAGLRALRERRAQHEKDAERQRAAQQTQHQAQLETQSVQAKQAKEIELKQQSYQRARGTCFKARGYTVSEG
jgi:hypothetical protein